MVGYYIDGSGIVHGYYRDASGTLHFPIDPSGSTATILFGLNDKNWVVGRYADSSGATHGLFFVPPNNFFTFDFPGSTFTSLGGINDQGVICGRYVDASGIAHGFLARVTGTPPTNAAGTEMKAFDSRSLVTHSTRRPRRGEVQCRRAELCIGEDLRCELSKEPCDNSVSDRSAVNVAPLQLGQKVRWIHFARIDKALVTPAILLGCA